MLVIYGEDLVPNEPECLTLKNVTYHEYDRYEEAQVIAHEDNGAVVKKIE